ncbi:tryptophan halogenase family protein [Pseudoalteromonas fenneropenaei]|uniref:Tryptophan halogenase family protein n=1 Tax=Pseudoalteromonas fenneropenaei TaxID=1737459 RepID=A0ABV7CFQ3_9GAMM
MNNTINHVVILGGGSAGWLTAALLQAELGDHLNSVTVIESPSLKPLGVGEGTWPSMRGTLERIGIKESDLVRHCQATFKQGSAFFGWRNGSDIYHHPFSAPWQQTSIDSSLFWAAQANHLPFAHVVSGQPRLIEQGIAPKDITTPEYAAINNYGYHFDANGFVALLKQHACETLGVKLIVDEVIAVNACAETQHILSLTCQQYGDITADLFIDCSGFDSVLLAKHYQVPFHSVKDRLFNDSALAVQVPYSCAQHPIQSATLATAQPHGWIWEIGLQNRAGIGHVFSSDHCSEADATANLMAYIAQKYPHIKDLEPRLFKFTPGYREQFWHKNVLAIGMAAGFVEPLEASALAMVELSARFLVEQFPYQAAQLADNAAAFNHLFKARWQDIVDFLKLHYVLSERTEAYWRQHQDGMYCSARLQQWLRKWSTTLPSRYDLPMIEGLFPAASWQYVYYGMQNAPANVSLKLNRQQQRIAAQTAKEYPAFQQKLTQQLRLPSNRELINKILKHGLATV